MQVQGQGQGQGQDDTTWVTQLGQFFILFLCNFSRLRFTTPDPSSSVLKQELTDDTRHKIVALPVLHIA